MMTLQGPVKGFVIENVKTSELQGSSCFLSEFLSRFYFFLILTRKSRGIKKKKPFHFVGYFNAERAGFRSVADPKICVRTGSVVMKIRNVESFRI